MELCSAPLDRDSLGAVPVIVPVGRLILKWVPIQRRFERIQLTRRSKVVTGRNPRSRRAGTVLVCESGWAYPEHSVKGHLAAQKPAVPVWPVSKGRLPSAQSERQHWILLSDTEDRQRSPVFPSRCGSRTASQREGWSDTTITDVPQDYGS
jgi:hypothetical protein